MNASNTNTLQTGGGVVTGLLNKPPASDRLGSLDQLASAIDHSVELAGVAFELELPEALDEAHRSLYALYSDRIWRAPTELRPLEVRQTISTVRQNLEFGFLGYLERRRSSIDLTPPAEADALGGWLESLVFGEHPAESGRWGAFVRDSISHDQLCEIVAQRSLFFLREPDPWIYAVPTLTGGAKAGLIDLLLDEYGWGKLDHMHSSVYARLMQALGLESGIDHFEPVASWQYLATLNHQWMLSLMPEYSRRLLGTIYLTEADSPVAMTNYLAAWERLGVSDPAVREFYEIHVHADENHRDVALSEVAVPVSETEPAAAAQVAIGISDGRTVEAEFVEHLLERFSAGESSLRSSTSVEAAE
ncbi:MAG: iron-containing redox enzyme family protein [Solirubrobacterales bacterium]